MKLEIVRFKARYICSECDIGCFREERNTTGELPPQPSDMCDEAEFTERPPEYPSLCWERVKRPTPRKWQLMMTWTTLRFVEVDHSNEISLVTHHHPDLKREGMRMEVKL